MGTYVNLNQLKFDETRYQTIGRGHGFSELDGVQFKLADRYSFHQPDVTDILNNKLKSLRVDDQSWNSTYSYSFELEQKVLNNMEARES